MPTRRKTLTKKEVTARELAGRRQRSSVDPEMLKAKARPVDEGYAVEKGYDEVARDRTPMEVIQERITSLEQSLKGLSYTLLHDTIHWRCEGCGSPNETLRYLTRMGAYWTCRTCGDQQRSDFQRFHIERNGGSAGPLDREMALKQRLRTDACDKSEGFLRR